MRKILFLAVIICLLPLAINAQKMNNCDEAVIKWDTIHYKQLTIISEVTCCSNTNLFISGISYYLNNSDEYLCFFYKYDKHSSHLKKITFWTFAYIDSGYQTKDKYAVLRYSDNNKIELSFNNREDNFNTELAELISQVKR